jgi:hypothetical protein
MLRTLAAILLLTIVSASVACVSRGESASPLKQSANQFPELAVKQKLQHSDQAMANRKMLTLTTYRSVKNGQGAGYVFPASMAYSDSGTLYISDNNGHRIHHWALEAATVTALPAESGSGQLKFPNTIQFANGTILISDNDGIKIFSREGHFQKLIRSYFGVFSFVTSKEGVFINTIIRNPKSEDPLIVKLDQSGRAIGGFGLRRNVAGHKGLDDQAYLAAFGNLLFAAFKYRPTVEVYNIDTGTLSGSFEIDHPVFRSLNQELVQKGIGEKQDQERIFLPRYLSGIRVLGDELFVCLALPEPEIWAVDQKGTPLAVFKLSGLPVAVDIFGFDVRPTEDGFLFSIGIIDQEWNATISQLKALRSPDFSLNFTSKE